nr:zinc knuckle CX2CX4HX4C [Tanacetum cinerariifolium]
MGIGVSSNVVAAAASLIGCSILTAPFNYLDVKVGSNMSRITSWDDVISKVSSRLSKWKLKLLSIGCRLSLLKSVLTSIPLYHMSIFKVPIGVLNHLESIRRNFLYGVDGSDRKLAWIGWNMVLTSKNNGGEVALKVFYKRLYALEMCKSISVAEKMGHPSLPHSFRRLPKGSQEFSVKFSRILIDNTILPKAEVPTRWLRVVPIKVNVHAWRVCLDKLPTRANLSLRGINISSIACPICNSAVESSSHIFFACPLARQIWRKFLIWWELEDVAFNSYNEWLNWIVNIRLHKQLNAFLEARMVARLASDPAGTPRPAVSQIEFRRFEVKGELNYTRVSEVPIIDHMDSLHSEGINGSDVNVGATPLVYVAATFGVSLSTVGDLHKLINDIKAGKHDELLSGMTNDDRMETLDALGSICNSIHADRDNAYVIPCKVSHANDSINLNVDESTIPSDHIVQSMDINTKSTSYPGVTGVSAKDQPKVNSNFCTLVADPVSDGVNVSIPRKVVKKEQLGETWAEKDYDEVQGFFFFKFDSRVGLEAVLEGGPWLIRKSPIILKKWSMDTRLLKEELTRILIWVKLHDVPIQVFEEDGISLIATFIGKLVMLDSYTSSMCNKSWDRSSFALCLIKVNSKADLIDVVTIGISSLSRDDFIKETICVMTPSIVTTSNVVTPTVKKTNDGFQMATTTVPRKGATFVGNTSQSSSMLKTTGISSKKDNFFMSNSFSALYNEEEDDDEDVENVQNESANLIQNTKAGGTLSFTAATG